MHVAENAYHEGSFKMCALVGSETESDPSNIDCGGDFLKIYNYQNKETQSEVASICGSETEVVISDTNSVYIIFTSDASTTASGFKIRYSRKRVPIGMIHGLFNSVGRAKSIFRHKAN